MKRSLLILIISILVLGTLFSENNDITVTDNTKKIEKVFNDLENEYLLAKIFFSNTEKKEYRKLKSDNAKWQYLKDFWAFNDPNPVTEENELLTILKARIEYSNKHYSHFKPGWKSDRGRIIIRHGAPYDLLKGRSDILGKHGQKDYEIWKYRIDSNMTFLFFDLQTHGDYRLIYSDNDEKESSYPDWYEYMGESFDTGLLY